jgi:hypothetical protein
MDWKTRTRFKQSSRVICIWWPGTQGWLLIPKRAFDSVDHANSFVRELANMLKSRPGSGDSFVAILCPLPKEELAGVVSSHSWSD